MVVQFGQMTSVTLGHNLLSITSKPEDGIQPLYYSKWKCLNI